MAYCCLLYPDLWLAVAPTVTPAFFHTRYPVNFPRLNVVMTSSSRFTESFAIKINGLAVSALFHKTDPGRPIIAIARFLFYVKYPVNFPRLNVVMTSSSRFTESFAIKINGLAVNREEEV